MFAVKRASMDGVATHAQRVGTGDTEDHAVPDHGGPCERTAGQRQGHRRWPHHGHIMGTLLDEREVDRVLSMPQIVRSEISPASVTSTQSQTALCRRRPSSQTIRGKIGPASGPRHRHPTANHDDLRSGRPLLSSGVERRKTRHHSGADPNRENTVNPTRNQHLLTT